MDVLSPNNEDSEDDTLRTILDDFPRILADILREEGRAVRHTRQQTHLQWFCSVRRRRRRGDYVTVVTVTNNRKMVAMREQLSITRHWNNDLP